ncbi:hypothetical protein [Candidatus Synechococcus spongiarum]|uniref:Uncharacterized protein n=1 Tax=Candidatus Synechococcus spongiarum TaxID=431041 RepID=A0A171DHY4_9SYNE|nr:hypothetical protein [Candidatus Synechococcus spongiarum]SAY39444.1 hypothetical protein FLM9_1595 [Candidatus Synechococcus spongiarum]
MEGRHGLVPGHDPADCGAAAAHPAGGYREAGILPLRVLQRQFELPSGLAGGVPGGWYAPTAGATATESKSANGEPAAVEPEAGHPLLAASTTGPETVEQAAVTAP